MKDITPEDSVVPVYLVPLTSEEEAERESWVATAEAEAQAKESLHQSALAKLQKLGLTEDEAKAIVGI